MPVALIAFVIFIFGLIAGSFMNVCIYRIPKKESIVTPPSHCPSCGKVIPWFDNIPLVSFIVLMGKCRFCKTKISLRYPLVELISGAVAAVLFLYFGFTGKFFIMWYLSAALIVISFIDIKIQEIPDEITLSGIILGLLLAVLYPAFLGKTARLPALLDSFLGVIAGGGSIYILGFLGEFVFKKEAMGGGDVKLLAMIGAFLGWKLAIFTFFLAPFFGAVVGITLKIKEGREIIPYGPYLSLAALVAMLWGNEIIDALFNIYRI
ncbi:prepilin peptidase [Candidatus Omnitrophota bacterium]